MGAAFVIAQKTIPLGEETLVSLQIGRLPSRTRIEVPVYISRAKKRGPVLLLLAGLHGDEINGVEILRRFITNGLYKPKIGTVICIPVLNIFGFINHSRQVPDGKDVNRFFPGAKHGSLASIIAYSLMQEIVPKIDFGIDFHTGGARRTNYPQVRCMMNDPVNIELASVFKAPFTLHAKYRTNSLRYAAAQRGKRILVYEGGESLRFDEYAIQEGIHGALRVMHHLGMRDEAPPPSELNRIIMKATWTRARAAGLFHPNVKSGDQVKRNQLIGTITDPFGEEEVKLKAAAKGYVIGLNHNPVVNRGDALVNIGIEEVSSL
jgi:uncharacterized protein